MSAGPIVLFDGACNFCNASVNFIVDHDPAGRFRFASLQSPAGARLLQAHGLPPTMLSTLVLIDGDVAHLRSEAALRVAARLSGPWALARMLMVVPRPLRDAVYSVIARNRHRLWPPGDAQCRVPTPQLRARFLDA